MASRKEVAAAAGVSVRTVSNVVSGFKHVSPETRQRVLESIEALGYHPSELARSLKVGRSGLVGLMLPELDVPYFAEITRSFVEQGMAHGLTVVIDQTDGDRERELAWINRAGHSSLFDALVLSPLSLQEKDFKLLPADVPVIILGEERYSGFDHIKVDGEEAAKVAVQHLIEVGRTRIAAIGAQGIGHGTSMERLAGYLGALEEAGIVPDPALIASTFSYRRSHGYMAAQDLLKLPEIPDAIFCFSDLVALGARRAIEEKGLRVPEDIALVGFDDIEDGRYSTPSLTTISPDKAWLAQTALDRLLARLSDKELEPELFLVPYELVVRESTVKLDKPQLVQIEKES